MTVLKMPETEIEFARQRLAAAAKISRASAAFDLLERLAQMGDDELSVLAGQTGVEKAAFERLSVFGRDFCRIEAALLRAHNDERRPQGSQHVVAGEAAHVGGSVIGHDADHGSPSGARQ